MFRTICFVLLGCTLSASAADRPDTAEHRSAKDLKTLVESAHTVEQYQKLSQYFHGEADRLHSLSEKQQAAMRNEVEQPTHGKYPSGYETALRLRDYYRQKALQAQGKAARYDRLIQSAAPQTASH